MSLSTYSDLQNAVANWLKRSDLTSYIPDLITLGEARVNNDLRVKAMETSLLSTMTTSATVAVPADYMEMKFAYLVTQPMILLDRKTPEWIYATYPNRTGYASSYYAKPKFYAREGSNFIFGPYPDSQYTIQGIYYAKPSALSSSIGTIFPSYPQLYLFAALAEAAPFLKDDKRVELWEAKYKQIKDRVQYESDKEEYSGGPLRMTSA